MASQHDCVHVELLVDPIDHRLRVGDFETNAVIEEMKVTTPELPRCVDPDSSLDQSLEVVAENRFFVRVGTSDLTVGKHRQPIDVGGTDRVQPERLIAKHDPTVGADRLHQQRAATASRRVKADRFLVGPKPNQGPHQFLDQLGTSGSQRILFLSGFTNWTPRPGLLLDGKWR